MGASTATTSTFSRQADGGEFSSTYELVATLESLGIPCGAPDHYISRTNDQVVGCTTAESKVHFIVARPGDRTFRSRLESDPATQDLRNLFLVGRNWALDTACDHEYGNRVRNAIGGEFLRRRFLIPSNCP